MTTVLSSPRSSAVEAARLPERQRELSVVRGPAFGVIAECLRLAAASPRPSRLSMLFGSNPLAEDAFGWYLSALGEIDVTRVLNDLGRDWVLLHPMRDVETTSAVDYLLVGAAGVFAVSIKDHTDQRVRVEKDEITVNGRRTDHLKHAILDAAGLARHLGVDAVTPLVVIVNPRSLERAPSPSKERQPNLPTVVGSGHFAALLSGLLKNHTNPLDRASIFNAVRNAELGGAWKSAAVVEDRTLTNEDAIQRLRFEVERASKRRALWLAVAALATAAAIAMLVLL